MITWTFSKHSHKTNAVLLVSFSSSLSHLTHQFTIQLLRQKIFQWGRKEVQGMNHFAICAGGMSPAKKAETVAKEVEDPTKSY